MSDIRTKGRKYKIQDGPERLPGADRSRHLPRTQLRALAVYPLADQPSWLSVLAIEPGSGFRGLPAVLLRGACVLHLENRYQSVDPSQRSSPPVVNYYMTLSKAACQEDKKGQRNRDMTVS
jgi:hypothetical protein